MPIRPQPWKVRCPKCGWSKRHHPLSDSLVEGDMPPKQCPKCGHTPLDRVAPNANPLDALLGVFKSK
ncbi:MAG TPA: hypothetical protein ENO09_00915 [bacterium]|nr:hypothetical protein [bacterium]